ncbi:hypothetical protein P9F86_03790 [Bacillus altitudinis]|uniref:hypothetical protein n=1 Tax=Bacillus TaxID=1386 RepID=UPI00071E3A92|nr:MULTISPECIES: hypothetical protein [Bacillus]KRV45917.1 hypothetical protein AS196_12515 [Bacillus sp. TH007]MEC2037972.1 hypothetical protein [Bacillus altitudinis]
MRWTQFKQLPAEEMHQEMVTTIFPFIKTLGGGITVVFKDQLPKAKGILDIIDIINRNAEEIYY